LQKALMTEDEYAQERQAVITASGERAIPQVYIRGTDQSLFELPKNKLPSCVPVLFIGIDPSGGSLTKSDLAMVALFPTPSGQFVVTAMMSFGAAMPVDEEKAVVSFVSAIRKNPVFKSSIIVPIVEANMKWSVYYILNYFRRNELAPIWMPSFGIEDEKSAVFTTVATKIGWAKNTQLLLSRKLVRFSVPCLTIMGDSVTGIHIGYEQRQLFDLLESQMTNYKFFLTRTGQLSLTGKAQGTNPRDDLVNAFFICLINSIPFCQPESDAGSKLGAFLKRSGTQLMPRE
jgi:hypothetical protein